MTIFNVISLAGGLALFLYGMNIMGSGLEKTAGGKLEGILRKLTSSTLRSVLLGAAITAVIQSSSGTTVIVVGLVNAGIMNLTQAVGIIMGANIGTTVTGQLLRLADISGGGLLLQLAKPSNLAPMVAFVGIILYMFVKAEKKRNIGQILMGFGILFTGMDMMTAAVSVLRDSPVFIELFTKLENPVLGILAGTFVTVLIQSSSASVGILQALSSTGAVTWGSAIPIIFGQNIGTCSTSLIACIGTSKAAKRSAMVHLYFNIIGTFVFMAGIYSLKAIFQFPWWSEVINMGDIANFHTLFNVSVTLLFIPFTKLLATLAERTIPDSAMDPEEETDIPVLDELLLSSPAVALQQATAAVETMAFTAQKNYKRCIPMLTKYDPELLERVNAREAILDRLEVGVNNYLVKIADHELTERESRAVSELLNFVVEFERIGDYVINVTERSGEIFDKGIVFSASAVQELALLDDALTEILSLTINAFTSADVSIAKRVEPLEETIDAMIDTLRTRHILRLKNGLCSIEAGVIFLEILTNLERISDHCSNVAARIVGHEAEDEIFDAHEFRRRMHEGYEADFTALEEQYRARYYIPLAEFAQK